MTETKDRRDMILHITGIKMDAVMNPERYGEEDRKKVQDILDHMTKDIYIDKTYVNYDGTRWKNAFIVEDKWYEFLNLVRNTNFGRSATDEQMEDITDCVLAMVLIYMYQTIEGMGWDTNNIELKFIDKKFESSYEYDNRTSWDF